MEMDLIILDFQYIFFKNSILNTYYLILDT